ncbi:uncharacterized protein BCR38DRAFT_505154 [Pseudomassariella vexata]|uniref:NmrA-like domain-containing protein n=1 Tax=Pseudomassariella vexata TaxID=1141098 RepID=A0A1Y2DAL7_9PEZI|nr:uncharacterized protein BCR38DRAFT_505154 [Pseudomassariella vexata]ORY56313.1 hypothetical protein BCR38DRAFT_505154 [Pseudomassariella vexata]
MTKIITVTGSTGAQGGVVVNPSPGSQKVILRRSFLKRVSKWSKQAYDKDSPAEAYSKYSSTLLPCESARTPHPQYAQGVHAIFTVTNLWEHLNLGKTEDEAGEIGEDRDMKLAGAAAQTPTFEHYPWFTTPSAKLESTTNISFLTLNARPTWIPGSNLSYWSRPRRRHISTVDTTRKHWLSSHFPSLSNTQVAPLFCL